MVFNCTLCGMGPRATIVLVGILSLIFSAAYVLFTVSGVLAHNCVIPMNNSVEEYAIYVYYLRNAECGKLNLTNLGITNVPEGFVIDVPDVSDAGHRTYILCIIGLVIYGLWFITSLFLLTSACVSCLGRCAIAFGVYPYVFVLFLVLAFDVVGLVYYMIDFVASFELDFVLDLLEIGNQDVVRPFFEQIDNVLLVVPPLIFWITAFKGAIIWFIFFLLAFVMLGVGSRLWEENKPAPPYSSVDPRTAQAATAPVEMSEDPRAVAAVRYNDPVRQPNDHMVFAEPPPPASNTAVVVNHNNNNVVRRTVEPLKVGYDHQQVAEPPLYRPNEPPSPLRNTVLNPYTDKRFSYMPGNPQPFSYLAGPPQQQMSPRNSTNVPEVRGQLPWSYFPAARADVDEPKRITSTLTQHRDFAGADIPMPTSKPGSSEDRSSDEGKWSGPEYRY